MDKLIGDPRQPCPIPLAELNLSDANLGAPSALPAACFTAPDFYRFEFEAVWEREWFCIGRATDIPQPGDYFTVTVGDDPLMAVRDANGTVRVMANVCQHRNMILLQGTGNTRRIRCPLHSWLYSLEGQLLSAPAMNHIEDFARGDVCLPQVRSELWEGFLFITFDESLPPIAGRLAGLSRKLENFRLSELAALSPLQMDDYAWDWKLYGDECYHCTHLHSRTWCNFFPTPESAIDEDTPLGDPDRGIIAYTLNSQVMDGAPTRTGRALHPILPGLTDEERSRLGYVTVMPNLLIVTMSDKVKYFLWLPRGPQKSSFGVSWLFPETTRADPAFPERLTGEQADLGPVMEEDVFAWSSTQAGLRSRFSARGRLSPKERVIAQFNKWLIEKYRAAAA